jgi:hypothetical protein
MEDSLNITDLVIYLHFLEKKLISLQ